jgi:hypothetical protein
MDNLRSERDRTLVALRDLEMGNDELERNERYVSLDTTRLSQLIV